MRERDEALLDALAEKLPRARERAERAAALATGLARELGVESATGRLIEEAARLHEVGKLYLSSDLLEPGAELDEARRTELAEQYEHGRALALGAGVPEQAAGWIRAQRERWDGSGPEGVAAEEIPLGARIVAAAREYVAAAYGEPGDDEGSADPGRVGSRLQELSGNVLDPGVAGPAARIATEASGGPLSPAGERVRFVILCLARTGSSHLVALLDSHPRVHCYGEVLNATHRASEGWFVESGQTDPRAHVDDLLRRGPEQAVGFKLPINSVQDHPSIVELLEQDRELRVIRLVRRNALAMLLSRRMLRETWVSQSIYGSYGAATVTISPAECVRALERIERDDRWLDELAEGHPTHRLAYEDLIDGRGLEEVQRFLDLEPAPLSSRYERLRTRPMSETIENWDELASALRGTPHEAFLEEDRLAAPADAAAQRP